MKTNEKPALLIMDVQNAIVNMYKAAEPVIKSLKKAIEKARKDNIPVIYVVIGFRKGYPEANPRNKILAGAKARGINFDDPAASQVYHDITPAEGDIVVLKKRVSAFTGSDLEVVLRAQAINHLVLTGIATSGVVLSTLREAADKDYILTVLSDCCADQDEEVHRVLTTKVFLRQADVVTVDQWMAGA